MWRVLLAYVTHRTVLFCAILFAVNQKIPSPAGGKQAAPLFAPFRVLVKQIGDRLAQTNEVIALKALERFPWYRIFRETKNPFYWVSHWLCRCGLTPVIAVLLLSNVLLFLFLWELHTLVSRIATLDVAVATPILVLLWPTSYELSLGSQFSLSCLLATLAARNGLDDHWPLAGLALAGFALVEPCAIALVPLLIYYFWFFQRHYPLIQVIKRTGFFLLPLALVFLWKEMTFERLLPSFRGSAAETLVLSVSRGEFGWLFSGNNLGQTITLLFFMVGGVGATVLNGDFIYRIIPLYFLALLMGFSSYSLVATRALLSGVCLQGIAVLSVPFVYRIVQLCLGVLSVFEVMNAF